MIKIKNITIKGIRGINNSLTLPLNKKSIIIFGENGAGKSSITDALEWFFYDKIEHLSSEEIGRHGKEAIRNIFIKEDEEAFIKINFSNSNIDSLKKIFIKKDKLQESISNTTEDFSNYINTSKTENIILRYKNLLDFILASKTDRLKKLSNIIGFASVIAVKEELRKINSELKKEIKIKRFDDNINVKQKLIIEQLNQNITSDEHYFKVINNLIKPLKLSVEIDSFDVIQEVLKMVQKPQDEKIVALQNSYIKIKEIAQNILSSLPEIKTLYHNYYEQFIKIFRNKEKLEKINLEKLLSEGIRILNLNIVKEEKCPLCLQAKNKDELLYELKKRIEELEVYKQEKEKLMELRDEASKFINNNILLPLQIELKEKIFELKDNLDLKKDFLQIQNNFTNIIEELKINVTEGKEIKKYEELIFIKEDDINNITQSISKRIENLTKEKEHDIRFDIYSKIELSLQAFFEIKKLQKEKEILLKQQKTMQIIYDEFIKKQREGLQNFLLKMSDDINELYQIMNPDEYIEEIKLIPLEKNDEFQGITFAFKFFGNEFKPPQKLFSESHLNCLGISFFLASVIAFNKTNKFFILDDVVSSFDKNHRVKLAQLLLSKFSDYQILLFTHEKDWFDFVAQMVKGKDWIIEEIKWHPERGAYLKVPMMELEEKINNKIKEDNLDGLGNDIRIYLEHILKEISYNLEVKVKFLFNDANENRMANELLSALKSKISKSGVELKDNSVFTKVTSTSFIGNKLSHDSSYQASIGDLKSFWDDVKSLKDLFYCSNCKHYISIKYYDQVNKKIRCKCGKKNYDWNI